MEIIDKTKKLTKFKDLDVGDVFKTRHDAVMMKLEELTDNHGCFVNAVSLPHMYFEGIEDDEIIYPVQCELTIM